MPSFAAEDYVRWADVDAAQIVRYDNYIRFFEIGESELFREAGMPKMSVYDRFDVWLVRKVLHAEYIAPSRLEEKLRVLVTCPKMGNSSFELRFEVVGADDGTVRATGYLVIVCVGRTSGRTERVPEEVRELLAKYGG